MADFGMAVGALTDTDTYGMAVAAVLGYHLPIVVENLADGVVDVPGEVSGLATYGAYRAMPDTIPYGMAFGAGALAYTGTSAAERVEVRSTITNLGA